MSNSANIRDIQVLSDLKAAFGQFSDEVFQILPSIEKQFEETREWLNERRQYWEREAEKAQDEVYDARQSLSDCENSGYYDDEGNYYAPDCSCESNRVRDAERQLAECEDNLETVKQWQHRIENQIADFQNHMHRLSTLASTHAGSAQAFLAQKIQVLDHYVGSTSASAGSLRTSIKNVNFNERDALAVLLGVEEVLARRIDTEKLIALDAQGKVVLERTGNRNSVDILNTDRLLLKDAILTHNHPSGRSFSTADLKTAQDFDIAELRAVGVAKPFTYVLKRPTSGWPRNLSQRYAEFLNELEDELSLKVETGELTVEKAGEAHAHESMLRLAEDLKLDYERKQRT